MSSLLLLLRKATVALVVVIVVIIQIQLGIASFTDAVSSTNYIYLPTKTKTTTPTISTKKTTTAAFVNCNQCRNSMNKNCNSIPIPTIPTFVNHIRSIQQQQRQQQHLQKLFLAKSTSHSRQASLREKLAEAKRQNGTTGNERVSSSSSSSSSSSNKQKQSTTTTIANNNNNNMSAQQIKEQNDRLRFEELLKKGPSSLLQNDNEFDGYLTQSQEEENISASLSGIERLFEGDPVPDIECFDELVSIKSENAIGRTGTQRLVPWIHKNTLRHNDYLILLIEPRLKSSTLYECIKLIHSSQDISSTVRSKIIIINADSPAENRRFLKRNGYLFDESSMDDNEQSITATKPTMTATTKSTSASMSASTATSSNNKSTKLVTIYSDEKREFMRQYTAAAVPGMDNRWCMSMFIIQHSLVVRIARDIDQYGIIRTITNSIKSLENEKRIL